MAIINGTSIGGMTLQIDYSYTQNTSANTTTVTAKLQLANHYALYASALGGSYISVGGSRTDYSASISYGGSSTTTTVLATKTLTVSHNSDGTGACNLAGTFVMNGSYRGYSVGTMVVDNTISLPTIPRASGLTVPTSINTGSALSGTISPSSSSFNHVVQLKIGSTVMQTINLSAGTTSFSATVPHSWFSSSTSGTVTVVLNTYSGSTYIANTSKNVTANVPSSVGPSISSFVAAIASNGLSGLYVQSKTATTLTVSASAGDGSSIASYTYSGPDIYSVTASNTLTTGAIQQSGTLTYNVQVKDGRGRTASASVQIYVYPYSAPSIGPVSVQRCDSSGNLSENGTYAKYTVNSSYYSVNGKNTRTVTVAYSSNNGTSYSSATTLQASTDTAGTKTGTYGGGAFAIANSYLIRFTITDSYGASNSIIAPLQSAKRPINISATGNGVAIGGMSTVTSSTEAGKFECSWDADFNKNVNIDGNETVTGTINGATINIDNNINGGAKEVTSHEWVSSSPSFIGTYTKDGAWYNTISVRHRNGQGDGPNYGMEMRSNLVANDALSWRQQTNGTWTDWKTFLDTRIVADYVVEQGASGAWIIRKWNSGVSECWRRISGTVTNSGTWNNFKLFSGSADWPSGLFIENPNAQYQTYIGSGYAFPARGGLSTTTKFIWNALGTDGDSNIGYVIDVYAIGRWK